MGGKGRGSGGENGSTSHERATSACVSWEVLPVRRPRWVVLQPATQLRAGAPLGHCGLRATPWACRRAPVETGRHRGVPLGGPALGGLCGARARALRGAVFSSGRRPGEQSGPREQPLRGLHATNPRGVAGPGGATRMACVARAKLRGAIWRWRVASSLEQAHSCGPCAPPGPRSMRAIADSPSRSPRPRRARAPPRALPARAA